MIRSKHIRVLALILCIAVLLGLAACSKSEADPTPPAAEKTPPAESTPSSGDDKGATTKVITAKLTLAQLHIRSSLIQQ